MDLDQLQSVRDRERQTDKLQQLRDSFYEDATTFVRDLREEREQAATAAEDPFDAPEVNRLTDRIRTAEQTIEAIYEKRVGKLVKAATFAAADLPAEADGMTDEEAELFETLVDEIRANRRCVLGRLTGDDVGGPDGGADGSVTSVSDGTSPTAGSDLDDGTQPTDDSSSDVDAIGDSSDPADGADPEAGDDPIDTARPGDIAGRTAPHGPTEDGPTEDGPTEDGPAENDAPDDGAGPGTPGVSAADVMDGGSDSSADRSGPDRVDAEATQGDGSPRDSQDGSAANDGETDPSTDEADDEAVREDGGAAAVERQLVRITDDVGAIFGVDQREYDLTEDDVVSLPVENARPLLERDAAERL